MNGTQVTETSSFNDILRPKLAPAESPRRPATGFMHPDEVVSDLRLTQAEKREILASWASDVIDPAWVVKECLRHERQEVHCKVCVGASKIAQAGSIMRSRTRLRCASWIMAQSSA